MAQNGDIGAFEDQISDLDTVLGGAGSMVAALSGEIEKMQGAMAATSRDAEVLSRGLSKGLKSAFDGVIFDGMRASDALSAVARSLVNTAYSAAIRPVTDQLGSVLSQTITGAFANGASFSQGRVVPFATGGVVSSATAFPMRGGIGVMGEAGPVAIMPLSRGADGKLGVKMEGGGRPVQIVMNISTPDVQGFQRSQSQIAAQMSRALSRGRRNG